MSALGSAQRLALAVPLLAGLVACGEAGDPKVMMIGIDGVRPDILSSAHTPNLDRLAQGGVYTPSARTGSPSVSGPGWSSFLTGVWPDKHGVTDNEFQGKAYDRFPDVLTRLESVRPELDTYAAAEVTISASRTSAITIAE